MPSTRQAWRIVCPSSASTCWPFTVTVIFRVPGTIGHSGV
jgi:hypothetical protein